MRVRTRWPILVGVLMLAGHIDREVRAASQRVAPDLLEHLRSATVFITILDPQTDAVRDAGTGFFISAEGDVATCQHLASRPGRVVLYLNSGQLASVASSQRQVDRHEFRGRPASKTSIRDARDIEAGPNPREVLIASSRELRVRDAATDRDLVSYTLSFEVGESVLPRRQLPVCYRPHAPVRSSRPPRQPPHHAGESPGYAQDVCPEAGKRSPRCKFNTS